jgi:hypothetical protein
MITEARMQEAGLDMYIWSTSGDERVRESHRLLDGLLCRWDKDSVYSADGGKTWKKRPAGSYIGIPGSDFSCRCVALAYWNELVGEVDSELDDRDKIVAKSLGLVPLSTPKITEDVKATPSPLIEKVFGLKQGKSATILKAAKSTNPHFRANSGSRIYHENCQRSVVAYELQRRGYDVEALPVADNLAEDTVRNGFRCFINSKKWPVMRATNGMDDLYKALEKAQDGERFIISQQFVGKKYGHDYIAEKHEGRIRFIDPQSGNAFYHPDFGDIMITKSKEGKDQYELFYKRVDNAILNPKIDITTVVKPIKTQGIDKTDSIAIQYNEDIKMTVEEARSILENSDEIKPWSDANGEIVHCQIGPDYGTFSDAYCFVVYPYSSKRPVNPLYAFRYFVDFKDGYVSTANAPIDKDELKKLARKLE